MNATELERRLYERFLEFFWNAEKKRRWSVNEDIPWQQATGDTPEIVDKTVIYFKSVEELIPDYGSKLTHLNRGSAARSSMTLNWSYEELRHGLALDRWLQEAKKRTPEQLREEHDRLLATTEWELPFDTQLEMYTYTTIQELATRYSYTNILPLASKDPALTQTLKFLAADEAAHHRLFFDVLKLYLQHKRDDTIRAIGHVFSNFSMPGYVVPVDPAVIKEVAGAGIYSARVFIAKVMRPIYEELGALLDKAELLAAKAPKSILGRDERPRGSSNLVVSYP